MQQTTGVAIKLPEDSQQTSATEVSIKIIGPFPASQVKSLLFFRRTSFFLVSLLNGVFNRSFKSIVIQAMHQMKIVIIPQVMNPMHNQRIISMIHRPMSMEVPSMMMQSLLRIQQQIPMIVSQVLKRRNRMMNQRII